MIFLYNEYGFKFEATKIDSNHPIARSRIGCTCVVVQNNIRGSNRDHLHVYTHPDFPNTCYLWLNHWYKMEYKSKLGIGWSLGDYMPKNIKTMDRDSAKGSHIMSYEDCKKVFINNYDDKIKQVLSDKKKVLGELHDDIEHEDGWSLDGITVD